MFQKFYKIGPLLRKIFPSYSSPFKSATISSDHCGKLSIFILAGQANMEGYGNISDYEPIETDGNVYVFDQSYKWKIGKEPVRKKIGPSISFASQILSQKPDQPIGLVNVAVGNTNIHQWNKSFSDTSFYQNLLKRALAASAQGKIEGLLFYQGENDALGRPTDHYKDWHVYFEKFVKDLRKDLHHDSLPVVYSQIGRGDFPYWSSVKESQEKVNLYNVAMIKSDDLKYQPDSLHFTTESYLELGRRFANVFIKEFDMKSRN